MDNMWFDPIYSAPQMSLYPSFHRPCDCAPPPRPCQDTSEWVCAKRLDPCRVPPRPCRCGRCAECLRRKPPCDLRGVELSIQDVDCCGNLILRVRRPRECCVNGRPVSCKRYY
ncbi:hypothetical protein LJC33_02335 [Eubacteriales bacterium OttesenSCG-928-N13]|nr:hypothetical protein [Eubacteriales bacterium OttesenSCG-928-N13]